eukprot:159808-Hanusia_phi.AAC.1
MLAPPRRGVRSETAPLLSMAAGKEVKLGNYIILFAQGHEKAIMPRCQIPSPNDWPQSSAPLYI